MKLVQHGSRTSIRIADGALLACPPMHPDLPSEARVAIFTAVLRRQLDQASSLAEEANAQLRNPGDPHFEAKRREALQWMVTESPDAADSTAPEDVKGPPADPIPRNAPDIDEDGRVPHATARGIVSVPAGAIPVWGMRWPAAVRQPRVLVYWGEEIPEPARRLRVVPSLPADVPADQVRHGVQEGLHRGVKARGELPARKAV